MQWTKESVNAIRLTDETALVSEKQMTIGKSLLIIIFNGQLYHSSIQVIIPFSS